MDKLEVVVDGVTGAVVMADDGQTDGLVVFDGDGQAVLDGAGGSAVGILSESSVGAGLGDHIDVFGIEVGLEVLDDGQLGSAVHAVDGSAEWHDVSPIEGINF